MTINCPKCDADVSDTYEPDDYECGIVAGYYCDACDLGISKHEVGRAKAEQHEYVRRKLLETGERPLIEGSWRDDFWGIGPNRDGQNMLGKLWMELRAEIAGAAS